MSDNVLLGPLTLHPELVGGRVYVRVTIEERLCGRFVVSEADWYQIADHDLLRPAWHLWPWRPKLDGRIL